MKLAHLTVLSGQRESRVALVLPVRFSKSKSMQERVAWVLSETRGVTEGCVLQDWPLGEDKSITGLYSSKEAVWRRSLQQIPCIMAQLFVVLMCLSDHAQ